MNVSRRDRRERGSAREGSKPRQVRCADAAEAPVDAASTGKPATSRAPAPSNAAAPASKEVFKVAREDILELMRLAEEQEFCQGWGVAWPAYMLDDKDHGSSLAVSNQLAQTIGYWGSAGEQRGPQPPARGGSSGPLPWGKKVAPLESEGWQVYPQLPPPPDAEGQEVSERSDGSDHHDWLVAKQTHVFQKDGPFAFSDRALQLRVDGGIAELRYSPRAKSAATVSQHVQSLEDERCQWCRVLSVSVNKARYEMTVVVQRPDNNQATRQVLFRVLTRIELWDWLNRFPVDLVDPAARTNLTTSVGYTWCIDMFSQYSKMRDLRRIHSPSFMTGGSTWRLVLFPTGNVAECFRDGWEAAVSVYLEVPNLRAQPDGWERKHKLSLIVHNQADPSRNVVRQHLATWNAGVPDFGYRDCIRLARLTEPDSGFLVGDRLVVTVQVSDPDDQLDKKSGLGTGQVSGGRIVRALSFRHKARLTVRSTPSTLRPVSRGDSFASQAGRRSRSSDIGA